MKAKLDLPGKKNCAKTRYTTVIAREGICAQRVVSKSKNKEASLEYRLKLVR